MGTAGKQRKTERGGARGTSAPGKPVGRRYSKEAQQEDRSEGQFRERMADEGVGWIVERLVRDVGEDFLVKIKDQGASTGLSFYVQLKSVRGAEKRKPKRGPEVLRYPLEVKDLLHWEVQTTLVVLVVWDVGKREGYWETISRIVAELDKTNEGWRGKKKVMVSVPVEHGTNNEGLRKLRRAIADYARPLVRKVGKFEMQLTFPPTDEGKTALQQLRNAIDFGEPAVVNGAFVAAIRYPPWHERLYGQPERPLQIELNATSSNTPVPIRIELESADGLATLPFVDLRPVRIGAKRVKLTNEHQSLPLVVAITLDFDSHSASLDVRRTRKGGTVYEERDVIAALRALTRPGSRLRVVDLKHGSVVLRSKAITSATKDFDIESLRVYHDLLEKLCFIQPRIASFGEITMERDISPEDARSIEEVFNIVRNGKLEKTVSLTFMLSPSAVPRLRASDSEQSVTLRTDGASAELLGLEIPLGRLRVVVKEPARFMRTYRAAIDEAVRTGKPARFQIDELPIVEEYIDWLPPDAKIEHLHTIAAAQAGYFTLKQALSAGFTGVESIQHVERCGSDVFRFVQFPPSDHEDLVILWLQTDKQGVFSHDTALALHHLSDILPSRRHITVPPGWEPPPDAHLDRGTVLHHADVDPSEVAWLGPIPFTKPLRTLRDCIEKAVSPDLLEQAITEAVERGLITKVDAQDLKAKMVESA